ncbi:MAG: hypothetical protein JXO72_14815 [Vicinamibacteria bacterium]|nr:hypothetical protein [Vicinamibacteria bacterium]
MITRALILSVLLAIAFFVLLRLRAPRWTFLVLGVLPPAILLLANPNLRVYGYHGFMQAGIVYQILQGHIPPPSPLLAGQPGTYPWAYELLLAAISKGVGLSPFWVNAIVVIGSLAILLVITYRIGLLVTGEATTAVFGVAASLYAFTFTQSVPETLLQRAFVFYEPRGAPILEKFNGCTAFPLGLALYGFVLLLLLRLTTQERPRGRHLASLALGLVAVGFIYPFFFPPSALLCLVAGLLSWRAKREARRHMATLVGMLAIVGLVLLPYYLQLKAGRAAPILQLVPRGGLVRQVGVLFVTLLPILVLMLWALRAVCERLRAQSRAAIVLIASVVMNLLFFTFLWAPLWSQYKYLLLGVFGLGILGGVAFQALWARSWRVALPVFSLFLLPFGLDCVHKATDWHEVPQRFRESGVVIEDADPAEGELYHWIRTKTEPRAVFVDVKLTIPVFGQRALFVALPEQEEVKPLTTKGGDGYTLDPRIKLIDIDGYPEGLVSQRRLIAARLLSENEPSEEDVAAVASTGSSAYLVMRPGPTNPRTKRRPSLPIAFHNAAATVFMLVAGR